MIQQLVISFALPLHCLHALFHCPGLWHQRIDIVVIIIIVGRILIIVGRILVLFRRVHSHSLGGVGTGSLGIQRLHNLDGVTHVLVLRIG